MKIGFIGTGTIAAAVIEGIVADGHAIWVSERSQDVSARLAARFDNLRAAGNQGVVDAAEVICLGLMADAAAEVLGALNFRADQVVFSFMAGVSLADVQAMVAPARAEAIVIPFPAIARGGSPVLCCPRSDLAEAVFGAGNQVIALTSEDDLAAYMAVQALLSPVVKLLAEGAAWAAERTGDAAGAERFLRLLVGGGLLAEPIDQDGVLAAMLDALNTPGGLNAELREHLGAAGTYDALRAGLDRLEARTKGDETGETT
ncbi:NAD(P)-binding domain-containing protein [Marimonas arenosa]|uniref:NAD(P)-binding domain-containing protein n=1 Tax=Marimonas arenosa TaxID=1795305 RepID=A0AAE3WBK9_9RHOB|nr:NAD(P)-binding domain-containing protein [Marimonas arenosa]MDQ2089639.1 NAD(P)-binding domain-containing protein [Marimonas arenosa]